MKKFVLLIISTLFVFCSCEEDYEIKTLTVASKQIMVGYGSYDGLTYLVKEKGDTKWNALYYYIEKFDYEENFEYVVQVKVVPVKVTMADQLNRRYILMRTISKIEKESEGMPDKVWEVY